MSLVIDLQQVHKQYRLFGNPLRQMLGYMGIGTRHVPVKHALKDVTLSIAQGERVGIIGHNGSGKTTLLRIISGYTQVSSGTVRVNGNVQALMQRGYGFNDHLSGLENIRNALIYNGLPQALRADAEKDIIDFVELGEFLYHPLKTYSLGMRARLEFAAATAIHPHVLVIDEVLGAGDGYFVRKCAARMRQLMADTTLLLVSHSLDQIMEYCERVIWIDAGVIREDGPTEAVLSHYRNHMNARADSMQHAAVTSAAMETLTPQQHLLAKVKRCLPITRPAGQITGFTFDGNGNPSLHTQTGDTVAFTLRAEVPAAHSLQPVVLGFTEYGSWVFELTTDMRLGEGAHTCSIRSAHSEIGVGAYVCYAALRDAEGAITALAEQPLMLCMAAANWSDPPLVHLNATWQSGHEQRPLTPKISAWV